MVFFRWQKFSRRTTIINIKDLTLYNTNKHCEDHLTRYKSPKRVEFVDEPPKTNTGKILRRKLSNQFI